jgi:hypothetical protein
LKAGFSYFDSVFPKETIFFVALRQTFGVVELFFADLERLITIFLKGVN